MKIVQICFLVALTILARPAAAQPAQTPSPEALQAATSLTLLISRSTLLDLSAQMVSQSWPTIESILRTRYNLNAGTVAEMRGEYERLQNIFMSDFLNEAPAIYARYLTVDEMRDLMVFYRSPSGMKMLRVMPQITAAVIGAIKLRSESYQTELDQALTAVLRRRGYIQ